MYKKQVRMFKSGYMINDNENEAENEKYRYGINRLSPRHGHKYTKYKMILSTMMVKATPKQHLKLNSWKS